MKPFDAPPFQSLADQAREHIEDDTLGASPTTAT